MTTTFNTNRAFVDPSITTTPTAQPGVPTDTDGPEGLSKTGLNEIPDSFDVAQTGGVSLDPSTASQQLGPSEIESIPLAPGQGPITVAAAEMLMAALLGGVGPVQSLGDVSAEDLLTAFMKLNANDPAKNPKTMNDLNELLKDMRKLSTEREQAAMEKQSIEQKEALAEAKEAKDYSNAMKPFTAILIVVIAIVAIVGSIFSAGAAGVAGAAAIAGLLGATSAAAMTSVAIAAAVIAATLGVVQAGISFETSNKNADATLAAADADEAAIGVDEAEKMMEFFQEMIGENQEIMQALMESTNQFMQLVKAMVTRQGDTAKVLTDATMRS